MLGTVRPLPFLLLAAATLLLSACGTRHQAAIKVEVIGEARSLFEPGGRLTLGAQLLRGATAEGLVTLDEDGKVTAALADRWIITDDGQSYIFRLRDGTWPDGSPISGESARVALRQAIDGLGGTPLAKHLDSVDDVRAMAGRVVEIRLSRSMPDFLQLLAQPELGLLHRGKGAGPLVLKREGTTANLTAIPPEKRGLPAVDNWAKIAHPLRLKAVSSTSAVADFAAGRTDVVLGGTFTDLPLITRSLIGKSTARLDPVIGLFGLLVDRNDGLLGVIQNREAIAMAIDRDSLVSVLGAPGWQPTTRMIAPGTDGDTGLVGERWADMDLVGRRTIASDRIATWVKLNRKPAQLRIALPNGPGADQLANRLVADLAAIGINLQRVGENAPADLRLLDATARFARPAWFLDQLSCAAGRSPCSRSADALAARASAANAIEAPLLYAQAERALAQSNIYIPLGAPIRWSLIGPDAVGFSVNRWASHPLLHMAVRSK